ncbi:hypothetical protein JCM8115_003205 [Rhodotorula mucilaginosa]
MDRDGRYSSYPPRPLASPPSTATSPFATPPITATFSPLPHDHLQYGYLDPRYATYSANSSPQLSQDGHTPPYAPPAWGEAVHAPIAAAAPPLAKPSDRKQRLSKRTGARIDWRSLTETYRTRNQLAFFAIIGVEAVAVLTMIALVYGTIRLNTGDISTTDFIANDPKLETVATYVSLFILAVLFEIGITLDACRAKNIMTLSVLCCFQFLMLVYSSVLPGQLSRALDGTNADTDHVHNLTHAYAIVIVAVVAVASVAMTGMLWPLYFDAFFLIGFSIQFLILVTGTPTAELVLTIIALPVSLVALILFAVIVRIESRPGVYCSWVIQVLGIAYFIYKISRIFSERSRYSAVRATLTIFAVICIIMLAATFCMMGLCMRNFDKGLRDRIPGYDFSGSSPMLPFRRRTHIDAADAGVDDAEKPTRPGLPSRHGTSSAGGSKANRTETRMSID